MEASGHVPLEADEVRLVDERSVYVPIFLVSPRHYGCLGLTSQMRQHHAVLAVVACVSRGAFRDEPKRTQLLLGIQSGHSTKHPTI